MSEPKEEIRTCPNHGKYIYPRWTRCELCPPPPARVDGKGQGLVPWTTREFTPQAAFYNMLMAWTPEQCRDFYAMLSRRPDFNPRLVEKVKELAPKPTPETAPAPTMGREEAERMADNLIAQSQHRDGHNAAEKGLPAARNTLIAALMARPDIHTEAAKWGYIPGGGGLRNPETGERDRS